MGLTTMNLLTQHPLPMNECCSSNWCISPASLGHRFLLAYLLIKRYSLRILILTGINLALYIPATSQPGKPQTDNRFNLFQGGFINLSRPAEYRPESTSASIRIEDPTTDYRQIFGANFFKFLTENSNNNARNVDRALEQVGSATNALRSVAETLGNPRTRPQTVVQGFPKVIRVEISGDSHLARPSVPFQCPTTITNTITLAKPDDPTRTWIPVLIAFGTILAGLYIWNRLLQMRRDRYKEKIQQKELDINAAVRLRRIAASEGWLSELSLKDALAATTTENIDYKIPSAPSISLLGYLQSIHPNTSAPKDSGCCCCHCCKKCKE